MQRCRNLPKI